MNVKRPYINVFNVSNHPIYYFMKNKEHIQKIINFFVFGYGGIRWDIIKKKKISKQT